MEAAKRVESGGATPVGKHQSRRAPRWARAMILGLVLGFSVAALGASGLAAMAMWVAATEHRYADDGDDTECIP